MELAECAVLHVMEGNVNYVMVTVLLIIVDSILLEAPRAEHIPALNVVVQASVPTVLARDVKSATDVVVKDITIDRVS